MAYLHWKANLSTRGSSGRCAGILRSQVAVLHHARQPAGATVPSRGAVGGSSTARISSSARQSTSSSREGISHSEHHARSRRRPPSCSARPSRGAIHQPRPRTVPSKIGDSSPTERTFIPPDLSTHPEALPSRGDREPTDTPAAPFAGAARRIGSAASP